MIDARAFLHDAKQEFDRAVRALMDAAAEMRDRYRDAPYEVACRFIAAIDAVEKLLKAKQERG